MNDDSARLDWLERNTPRGLWAGMLIGRNDDDSWEVGDTASAGFNGCSQGEGATLREAIDAAMQAYPASPPPQQGDAK